MKRIVAVTLAAFLLLTSAVFCVSAEEDITVTLNGQALTFTQPPVIINDRTMVPMRAIFEALGATVEWEAETRTAIGHKNGISIRFPIDKSDMTKNTVIIPLDAPAALVNDTTMLPVRAVAESFGVEVYWEAATRTVQLTDMNRLGNFTYESGLYYEGEMQNELPNGYGTATNPKAENKVVVCGLFQNGVVVRGTLYSDNGDYYVGSFKDRLFHGYGEYYQIDKEVYKGQFAQGKKEGYGEVAYVNGDVYKGNFKNDEKEGYGEYSWADGDVYKGNYVGDLLSGYGEFYYANGDVYRGNFENNDRHGYGEYTWADGDVFKGYFANGVRLDEAPRDAEVPVDTNNAEE